MYLREATHFDFKQVLHVSITFKTFFLCSSGTACFMPTSARILSTTPNGIWQQGWSRATPCMKRAYRHPQNTEACWHLYLVRSRNLCVFRSVLPCLASHSNRTDDHRVLRLASQVNSPWSLSVPNTSSDHCGRCVLNMLSPKCGSVVLFRCATVVSSFLHSCLALSMAAMNDWIPGRNALQPVPTWYFVALPF
jgi:hypothetical protein